MIQYKIYDWRFDAERFSEAIRNFKPHFSDDILADILEVDHSTLSNWRNQAYKGTRFNHPHMANFIRICNELDLDPRDFFCLVED